MTETELKKLIAQGEALTIESMLARRVFSLVMGANGECVVGE